MLKMNKIVAHNYGLNIRDLDSHSQGAAQSIPPITDSPSYPLAYIFPTKSHCKSQQEQKKAEHGHWVIFDGLPGIEYGALHK